MLKKTKVSLKKKQSSTAKIAIVDQQICLFNIMTNETIQTNSTTYKSMLKDFKTVSVDFINAINHYK